MYKKVDVYIIKDMNKLTLIIYLRTRFDYYRRMLESIRRFVQFETMKRYASLDALKCIQQHPIYV